MIQEGKIRRVYLNVPHSRNPTPSGWGESVGHYEGGDTHTNQLHVIERFKITDGGKRLDVSMTMDDPGTFYKPFSARRSRYRVQGEEMVEDSCAANNDDILHQGLEPAPTADKPDSGSSRGREFMHDFRNFAAGAGVAVLASVLAAPAVFAAGAEPDISGIWWATTYSPRIQVLGGGDPPLNAAGKAQYAQNEGGLRNGSLVDKARKVCIPDGVPRVLETPYPFEIYQVPRGQITMIHELNHQLRVIPLDKPLPKYEDVSSFENYNGHTVAHWEGDTLVIQGIGYNDDTFLDSTGLPHSDQMVTTERVRKAGNNQLEDVVTIHDPNMYTRDWQARFVYTQRNDIRMEDYSCNDAAHRDLSQVRGVAEARALRAQGRFP